MTSKIKVNILADGGDNAIITSDGAGSFTASSGLATSVASVGSLNMTPAFHFRNNSNQSIANVTNVQVSFDTERYNTGSCYSTSTNRFTPNVAGKYFIYSQINMDVNTGVGQIVVKLYKNGGQTDMSRQAHFYGNNQQTYNISTTIDMNGSTDYLEIYVYQDSGSKRTLAAGVAQTYFGGFRVLGA